MDIDRVIQGFYEALASNPELRLKFARVLGVDIVRHEDLSALVAEIRNLRIDFQKHCEESNRRFDQLIAEMNKRFEEVNKRFEENDRRFDKLVKTMDEGFALVYDALKDFSSKFGIRAEAAARRIGREFLKGAGVQDYNVEQLFLEDEDGDIFVPGYTTDVDLYYHDSEKWLIEYKITCAVTDVEHFAKVCDLAELQGIKPTRKIIVAMRVKPDCFDFAAKYGIEIWHAKTEHAKKNK